MSHSNVIFICTRLADYLYRSIIAFLNENEKFSATVFTFPSDANSPFQFENKDRLELVNLTNISEPELIRIVSELRPAVLYFGGWNKKIYTRTAQYFYGTIPTILGLDNPWTNSIKQNFRALFLKRFLHTRFSHIWCAGEPQYNYALRLGYEQRQIRMGLYSANIEVFHPRLSTKDEARPKNLLFIGRYVHYKNPHLLVSVFTEILNENKTNGWTITFVGSGPLKEKLKRFENPSIRVMEFNHPSKLPQLYQNSGAFCLPSNCEHWGVVVHEAAAAALPLILSDTVHSHTQFLVNGDNGWLFKTNDRFALKSTLVQLFHLSDNSLKEMGMKSLQLSKRINHATWTAQLNAFIDHP